ncbi:hypothetical protein F4811DRAFT_529339 [Daldinia bambusicola]|nr:hypothetical protein F4811DRAFT_529339 [Daldinia bambusicola]
MYLPPIGIDLALDDPHQQLRAIYHDVLHQFQLSLLFPLPLPLPFPFPLPFPTVLSPSTATALPPLPYRPPRLHNHRQRAPDPHPQPVRQVDELLPAHDARAPHRVRHVVHHLVHPHRRLAHGLHVPRDLVRGRGGAAADRRRGAGGDGFGGGIGGGGRGVRKRRRRRRRRRRGRRGRQGAVRHVVRLALEEEAVVVQQRYGGRLADARRDRRPVHELACSREERHYCLGYTLLYNCVLYPKSVTATEIRRDIRQSRMYVICSFNANVGK